MKPRRSVFKTIVAPLITAVVFVPTVAMAIWEVAHGRGAATYSNVYGLAVHYTSVLIALFALALAALVAFIARAVYFWRERDAK
jgi:preprotein translocase subunit SecY